MTKIQTEQNTPGFKTLSKMSPSWWGYEQFRFLHVVGSISLVVAVSENDRLKNILSNRPSLYLGRISYGLYMAHGPLIHMLGDRIIPQLWQWTNGPVQEAGMGNGSVYKGGTAKGYEMGFLLGGAVVVICTVYAADLITRLVDEPIVRLCRRIDWQPSDQ
jgi:peptidoglycan/LPS O-acetylase OafA/YrhL